MKRFEVMKKLLDNGHGVGVFVGNLAVNPNTYQVVSIGVKILR